MQVISARMENVPLEPRPIHPDWILAGTPHARFGSHSQNVDGWAETAHWDCTAGRFRWHFGWEETVVILEGEVRVTDSAGTTTVLRAGDVAYFPARSWFTWEVDDYVRKIAFCRRPVPRVARLLSDLPSRLRKLLMRAAPAIAFIDELPAAFILAG
jgi:uncharacterized cupin superfamily protein